ncbi:MAG: NAD(P)-dependent alcohol dehydrogenase [Hyphomicrobiales bacterium]|nr:NAD(P)-dependent alcohol dehydrogenase [Hyphomicrobiales bacterium]
MFHLKGVLDGGFGIGNLQVTEAQTRDPGRGEVRLRVEAVSLNRRDLLLVQGVYNPRQNLPSVPCSDGAGFADAIGPGCSRIRQGDRVVLHMMPLWMSGEPSSRKLSYAMGGASGEGTLEQMIIVPETALLPIPDDMSFEAAATLPCAALTAWSGIVTLGDTQPGDTVMVQGTGGVSLFALQFAKMNGAFVVATTSSAEREQRLKTLGADATVNYRADKDWARTARNLAPGGRIDLIMDVGGGGTLDASLRVIRPGGAIALIGVLEGARAEINLPLAVMRQVRLQGVTTGSFETFEAMLRAIAKHGVDPVIDTRFGFADIHKAFERMDANAHVGKIIIKPWE